MSTADKVVFVSVVGGVIALIGWLLYWNWNKLVNEAAAWARRNQHAGVLRFLVVVENVRAGVYNVVMKFLGARGESQLSDPEEVVRRSLAPNQLPPEFRATGEHRLDMQV